MTTLRSIGLACGLALLASAALAPSASAQYYGRQYYGGWGYNYDYGYYYCQYNYQPYSGYDGYQHHYAIYYPSQPRYVYYYNPYRHYYWGRLDLDAKGDEKYSKLEEKDRKESLKDIDPSAFPKPARMPAIPESKDDVAMKPVTLNPATDLPKIDKK
jgi:hypothetical protein